MNAPVLDATDIFPTGRSFGEYCAMFDLSETAAPGAVLGVGDGLSNFNAEATRRGWRVTSADPVYQWPLDSIEQKYRRVLEDGIRRAERQPHHWVWRCFDSTDALRAHRRVTLRDFVADFPAGLTAGRYVAAGLPSLPFPDSQFDLTVCSHVLFTWSGVLDLEFHLRAIEEMLRLANQVRVFPTSDAEQRGAHPYLAPVMEYFRARGCDATIHPLDGAAAGASARLVIGRAGTSGKLS